MAEKIKPTMEMKTIPVIWIRILVLILISLYSMVVFGQDQIPPANDQQTPAFRVYPTLSSYDHRLDFVAEKAQSATVRWVDITGRMVYREELELVKGANSFSIRNQGKLSKGTYILSVVIDGRKRAGRVIIM